MRTSVPNSAALNLSDGLPNFARACFKSASHSSSASNADKSAEYDVVIFLTMIVFFNKPVAVFVMVFCPAS
jgi:hypothetical protein